MFLLLQGQEPHKFTNLIYTERAFGAGVVSSAAPRAALGDCGGVITGSKVCTCLLCMLHPGWENPPMPSRGI